MNRLAAALLICMLALPSWTVPAPAGNVRELEWADLIPPLEFIENPLAEAILAGAFAPGDTIEVALKGGEFSFSKAAAVSEAA